jgi:hypothetical protein
MPDFFRCRRQVAASSLSRRVDRGSGPSIGSGFALLACTILAAPLLSALRPQAAQARIWRVSQDGSGDFTSIQAAIQRSTDGDEIQVSPGTYVERLRFAGRAVVVRSTMGPLVTTIDADSTGSVVTMDYHEGQATVLDGFTLTGGIGTRYFTPTEERITEGDAAARSLRAGDPGTGRAGTSDSGRTPPQPEFRQGGGILLYLSSPTLRNLIVKGNGADYGGGLYGRQASPRISDCQFARNVAGWGAGAYFEIGCAPEFDRCSWSYNYGASGAGLTLFFSVAGVRDSRFIGNNCGTGGALYVRGNDQSPMVESTLFWKNTGEGSVARVIEGALDFRRCTIAANGVPGADPAVLYYSGGSRGTVENTILADNTSDHDLLCEGSSVVTSCDDFWPTPESFPECPPGTDEFSANPLFCEPDRGDFRLRDDSPCLPGRSPDGCGQVGAFGAGCRAPAGDVRNP